MRNHNDLTLPENVYGHRKRLEYIQHVLETFTREHHKKASEIDILDIGCGTGEYITRPLGAQGYTVIGIDVDAASIARAKQMPGAQNVSFEHYPPSKFPTKKFDAIICSEVLEHLEDPFDLLNNIHSLLKKDGIFMATTPNGYGWFEFEKFLYETLRLRYPYHTLKKWLKRLGVKRQSKTIALSFPEEPHTLKEHDDHLQHFTLRRLRELFRRAGFEVVEERGSTVFSGPFTGDLWHRSSSFITWNARLADRLPLPFVSGWYFLCKPHTPKNY